MTKKEFLESKGYILTKRDGYQSYRKFFINSIGDIDIDCSNEPNFLVEPDCIASQKDIDNLQITFNNVKRDFEEMMECED